MWYWIFHWIFLAVFRLFFRLEIKGLEHIPEKTNFIIVSNHTSFLDPVVIMAAVPKKIFCIAMRDIYKIQWLGWFLHVTETLPSGSSSTKAIELLRQNKNVGLFPEGGVSRDGRLKEFRRGAALLAIKTGRPIVPCAIQGTFASLPFGARVPKLRKIKLVISRPVYLTKEFDEYIDDVYLQEGMLRIRTTIKGLLDAG